MAVHSHRFAGQTLTHNHPGGSMPHGYLWHPEDGTTPPPMPPGHPHECPPTCKRCEWEDYMADTDPPAPPPRDLDAHGLCTCGCGER